MPENDRIYAIGGLGADSRIFKYLQIPGYDIHCIEWIPVKRGQSIEEYAGSLLKQIQHEKPILLGVSFGGMIAVEIAKQINTEKVILISSAKTKNDIPLLFRIIGKIGLQRVMPIKTLKNLHSLTNFFFSVRQDKHKELLKAINKDTPDDFFEWAIDAIVTWKNTAVPGNLISIHGTSDRLLPNRHPDHTIVNGGHFMIVDRGSDLNLLLSFIL